MKVKFLVLASLLLFSISCNSNNSSLNANSRPNPKPSKLDDTALKKAESLKEGDLKVPEIFLNKKFEDLAPVVPKDVNLDEFEFDLEIKFDGVLGRVFVDDGEKKFHVKKNQTKSNSYFCI